jgi:hypothetical protein
LTQNYSSFLYFFSFFFFLGLHAGHVKNHQPFNLFIFLFNPSYLICNCIIYIDYF